MKLKEDQAPYLRRKDWIDFEDAKRLTCVRIPRVWWMKSWNILASTFKGCVNLRDIYLPEQVTKLPKTAFKDCKELTIHAPAGSFAESCARERQIPFQAC